MKRPPRSRMPGALQPQPATAPAAVLARIAPALVLLLIIGLAVVLFVRPALFGARRASGPGRVAAGPSPVAMLALTKTPAPTATPPPSPTPAPTATPLAPVHVLRTYPIDNDTDVLPGAPLRLVFDQPMDTSEGALQAVISPSVQLGLEWAAPDTLVLRAGPWQPDVHYELALRSARGQNGAPLAGALTLRFRTGGKGAPIPILMFHELTTLPADAGDIKKEWSNSPEDFRATLALLDGLGAHIVALEQVADYLGAGAPLPARPVALTFDDGYTNAYQVAVPLLAERRESGTFFLAPEMLGFGAYLDWTEIADMQAKGMTIASHGLHHTEMYELGAAAAEAEFGESRRILREHTGAAVDLLSFPYGAYSSNAIAQAAAYGYRAAVSINPTSFQQREQLYHLGRLHVAYGQVEDFREMLPWR